MIKDESKMGTETPEEIVPLDKRNKFQIKLMAKMLGTDHPEHQDQENWAAKYLVRISEIIDDTREPPEKDVHGLILAEKYEDAVEMATHILDD